VSEASSTGRSMPDQARRLPGALVLRSWNIGLPCVWVQKVKVQGFRVIKYTAEVRSDAEFLTKAIYINDISTV